MDSLSKAQQIAIATFFGLLGVVLWTLPFYLSGKEMVRPTGIESEWTEMHWLFILFGTIAIAVSLRLSRIDKLFNLASGFLSKFSPKKKDENGTR